MANTTADPYADLREGEIGLLVADPNGSRRTVAAVRPEYTIESVISAVKTQFQLPDVNQRGGSITYAAKLARSSELLRGDSTVGAEGLQTGDELLLKSVLETGC
ncbi:MAG: hypothetical protein KJ907_10885 [Actinobacteria bacterium]|nr:hypothetical protein [Actinomycetota bacterium]MBU4403221.1 hypothetical protein [Actinomycetota bacterium]